MLDAFKRRQKTIILEVEPAEPMHTETIRRVRFYEKNGFRKAQHILYTLSDDDGDEYTMDVYYWSPHPISEREVLHEMAVICREIHNFKSLQFYGRIVADPQEVLHWEQ